MLVAASDGFGDLSRTDFDISYLFRRKPGSDGAGQRDSKSIYVSSESRLPRHNLPGVSLSLKPVEEAPKLTFSYEAFDSSTAGLPESKIFRRNTSHNLTNNWYTSRPS